MRRRPPAAAPARRGAGAAGVAGGDRRGDRRPPGRLGDRLAPRPHAGGRGGRRRRRAGRPGRGRPHPHDRAPPGGGRAQRHRRRRARGRGGRPRRRRPPAGGGAAGAADPGRGGEAAGQQRRRARGRPGHAARPGPHRTARRPAPPCAAPLRRPAVPHRRSPVRAGHEWRDPPAVRPDRADRRPDGALGHRRQRGGHLPGRRLAVGRGRRHRERLRRAQGPPGLVGRPGLSGGRGARDGHRRPGPRRQPARLLRGDDRGPPARGGRDRPGRGAAARGRPGPPRWRADHDLPRDVRPAGAGRRRRHRGAEPVGGAALGSGQRRPVVHHRLRGRIGVVDRVHGRGRCRARTAPRRGDRRPSFRLLGARPRPGRHARPGAGT